QIHASGYVPTETEWPSTWTDRRDRDRTPSIPGHELAGVVTALGYGTTGLSVGQRVFGLADWHRDGTLAEGVCSHRGAQPRAAAGRRPDSSWRNPGVHRRANRAAARRRPDDRLRCRVRSCPTG